MTSTLRDRIAIGSALAVLLAVLLVPVVLVSGPAYAQEGPPSDADHLLDWSSLDVGDSVEGMTQHGDPATVQVSDSTWAHDGRALTIDPSTDNGQVWLTLDALGDVEDVEIVARMRHVNGATGSFALGAFGRADPIASGVVAASRFDLAEAGTFMVGSPPVLHDLPTADPVEYLRVRFEADTVSLRAWSGSLAEEPSAWHVEHVLDGGPTVGAAGLFRWSDFGTSEVDWVAAYDLDSDPEPDPEPDPEDPPSDADLSALCADGTDPCVLEVRLVDVGSGPLDLWMVYAAVILTAQGALVISQLRRR